MQMENSFFFPYLFFFFFISLFFIFVCLFASFFFTFFNTPLYFFFKAQPIKPYICNRRMIGSIFAENLS